jgi:hypothetical protein
MELVITGRPLYLARQELAAALVRSSVLQVAPFRVTLFKVVAAWTLRPHSWHARDL